MIQKASVIDLGSNSAKLVNFTINPDNSYKAYQQEGVRVKLGDGLTETGFLGDDAIKRAIKTLKLFKDIIKFQSINHVLPVATSAVREAANKDEFLDLVKKETGFNFRVLGEEEEALYSYVGAIRSLRLPSVLFFDIGGGSLEIVHAENFKIKKIMSLPLGTLRLTQMFAEHDGSYKQKEYSKMRSRILDLIPFSSELNLTDDCVLVGVGGTVRAIAKYHQAISNYPLNKVHNYSMNQSQILGIDSKFRSMRPDKIAKIDEISSGRAETIIAGVCVVSSLMNSLSFDRIVVSAQGLREGTLSLSLEYPREFAIGKTIDVEKIQNSIRYACEPDILPQRIEDFVRWMISLNQINEKSRIILAQTLRHVEKPSSFRSLESLLHFIMDEDSSLTHREQLISALSLIYSKKKKKAERLISEFNLTLNPDDVQLIKKISLFVTLSEILSKTQTQISLKHSNESKLSLKVYPKSKLFPETMFADFCKKFESVFDFALDSTIVYNVGTPDQKSIQI